MNRTKYKEEDFMHKKMGKLYVCGPMEYLVDKTLSVKVPINKEDFGFVGRFL